MGGAMCAWEGHACVCACGESGDLSPWSGAGKATDWDQEKYTHPLISVLNCVDGATQMFIIDSFSTK